MVARDAGGRRSQVLDAAERLFAERGYRAVSLRELGERLGIRHASLYHHIGGKEALFVEVVERACARHRAGLDAALAAAAPDISAQLAAAAAWFVSQPPVDLMRMVRSDSLALSPESAERIARAVHEGLKRPLIEAVAAAQQRGGVRGLEPDLFAGAFLVLMDGIYQAPRHVIARDRAVAAELVSLLLEGALPRADLSRDDASSSSDIME